MCITMFCSLLYLLVLPPFPPSVFQADLLRLNGNSQTFFLTGWGGQMTELWLFSWLPSRDMRPPGSFLAGETLQTLVSGTSGMVGLPPTRLRKAAWAWPEFRDFFPWISRGVHCLQLCWVDAWWLPSSKVTQQWRRGCCLLLPIHFHGVGSSFPCIWK